MRKPHQLPTSVMRLPGFAAKKDNREIIIDHLIAEDGAVKLTELQQELLSRWHRADDLMRCMKYSSREVAQILCKETGCAPATARRDMEDARFVFGTTRGVNKGYLLSLHLERIDALIVLAERSGRSDLIPKLCDTYTAALKLVPQEVKESPPPTAIVFNFTTNNFGELAPDTSLTPSEATAIAADRLSKWGAEIDDIMHEEVEDE